MNKKRPTYKNFHIDYLPLLNEDKLGNTEPFNLLPYIEMCCKKDVSKRVSNYNGEVCRLQDIENIKILPEKLHERDLWKLNFVRIKTNSMTGVANEDGSYDPEYIAKKLSDKDYLAEPTTCIYDSAYNTIIISRNRDGILPSGILEFFKKITGIRSLKFGIIPTKTTFSKANTNIYRNISIGIDDLDKLDERSKTFLEKRCNSVFGAITALKPYQNINLRLNLSMGKANKKQGMNVQKVNEEL
ncbi:hypothetical protein FDB34_11705 [Clostridium botulinum]|nr:hypothetical protein [Clostridium botulinum]